MTAQRGSTPLAGGVKSREARAMIVFLGSTFVNRFFFFFPVGGPSDRWLRLGGSATFSCVCAKTQCESFKTPRADALSR